MSALDQIENKNKGLSNVTADLIRDDLLRHTKNFKTSWIELGQNLHAVYQDKLFYAWGYEKFEHYVERELGIKKPTAMKMLKSYFFVEQEEPQYLSQGFREENDAPRVPSCDAINVLRLARRKRELTRDDYAQLRQSVFEKGKDATGVRKDLVAMMKERKQVDPEEERHQRNQASLKKLAGALMSFQKDMEALKLSPAELIEETRDLMKKIEQELD